MIFAALLVIAFFASLLVCGLMIRLGPKDAPDGGRKTQSAPVPSSGGLGVLAGAVAGLCAGGLLAAPFAGLVWTPPLAGLAGFAVFAALLGWADDVFGLPAAAKFAAVLTAACAAAMIGPQPDILRLGALAVPLPVALGAGTTVVLIFVMSNAVNFMDGANGIAMGVSLICLAALALMFLARSVSAPEPQVPAAAAAGLCAFAAAIAGFLVWNLSGRLYAGDSGALSVGGLIGGASALYAVDGSILAPLTLCLPILIDVFLTLAWRARNGRPLMQAHRDHAYQLLLRSGWPHGRVARLWWGFSGICAAAVLAGPAARDAGIHAIGGDWLDAAVFAALTAAGAGLWLRQRFTLGRALQRPES